MLWEEKKIAYACIKFANVLNSSLLLFWCNIYFFSQEIQLHCCHKTCMGEQVSSLWIFIFISKWRHISMATERNVLLKEKLATMCSLYVLFVCITAEIEITVDYTFFFLYFVFRLKEMFSILSLYFRNFYSKYFLIS